MSQPMPDTVPGVASHPDRVLELRALLDEAVDIATMYLDSPVWQPALGSEGVREFANGESGTRGPWGDIPVRTAHALSHALLDAAVAHVRALALLYVGTPPPMAPSTVARSTFETAATAWWLMEPGIGARSRVARVTSERLRSAREAAKAISALEGPVNPSDYSETQAQVIVYATDLGLSAAAGDPRIEGEVRPNSTDLITTLFATDSALSRSQAQLVYPVYSGVAHGLLYGIEQFLRPEEIEGEVRLAWKTDPYINDAVVSYTLAAFIAAMERLLTVMGWDRTAWDAWTSTLSAHFASP